MKMSYKASTHNTFRVTNKRRIDEKGHPDGCPFCFYLLDHVVAAYQVCLRHVCVDLRSVDIAVTEHALHNLYGNSTSQTYGGGEGVAGAVGGELLSQLHFPT